METLLQENLLSKEEVKEWSEDIRRRQKSLLKADKRSNRRRNQFETKKAELQERQKAIIDSRLRIIREKQILEKKLAGTEAGSNSNHIGTDHIKAGILTEMNTMRDLSASVGSRNTLVHYSSESGHSAATEYAESNFTTNGSGKNQEWGDVTSDLVRETQNATPTVTIARGETLTFQAEVVDTIPAHDAVALVTRETFDRGAGLDPPQQRNATPTAVVAEGATLILPGSSNDDVLISAPPATLVFAPEPRSETPVAVVHAGPTLSFPMGNDELVVSNQEMTEKRETITVVAPATITLGSKREVLRDAVDGDKGFDTNLAEESELVDSTGSGDDGPESVNKT